jgi:D-sedoheptulose 7-phosphate isomerase
MRNLDELKLLLASMSEASLIPIFQKIRDTIMRGGTIFFAGNGGSAATSSHMTCDLSKNTVFHPKVLCLTDCIPALTAYSNDVDYKSALARQLRILGTRGDCLIVLSVSGESPNIISCLETAKALEIQTIGLLGFSGGEAKRLCDTFIVVESSNYGVVEDMHSIILHTLVGYLQ